jgi:hypothetical protein
VLACHVTLICVDDTAVADTPVGAAGGGGAGVVALAVADGADAPFALVAMIRYE